VAFAPLGVPRTQLANPRKQRACLASATPAYKGSTPSDFEEFPSSLEITSRSTLHLYAVSKIA
jgi:hypothetical protein